MGYGAGRELVVLVSFVTRGRRGRGRPRAFRPKREQRRRLFISLEVIGLLSRFWKVAQAFGLRCTYGFPRADPVRRYSNVGVMSQM